MIMKSKFIRIIIYIGIVVLTAIGCKQKEAGEKYISVTIEPQRFFLEQIVGDKYKVKSLIPSGNNPESYDPSPSQMITLENSIAYFKLGLLGIENVLISKASNQKKLLVFDCSKGIEIIQAHECEDHAHHHSEEMHGHESGDPHYWTSITSARIMLENMYLDMVLLDSINKEFYTENFALAIAKIDSLEKKIETILKDSSTKAFVIYHPALSYFANEFGLVQLSIEKDGKNPSPNQLKEIIDSAIEHHVQIVFIQKEYDIKNGETVAKQIGAATYSIDLMDYNWDKMMLVLSNKITGE